MDDKKEKWGREYNRAYYRRDPARRREINRWYWENKVRAKLGNRKVSRAEFEDLIKQAKREYIKQYRARTAEHQRERRKASADSINNSARKYWEKKARALAGGKDVTPEELAELVRVAKREYGREYRRRRALRDK